MGTRDFDAARAERLRERDPIRFLLGGETFTCLPVIPVGVGIDLADAPEPAVRVGAATRALISFIDNALVDDDRPRFQELLRRRVDPVDGEALWEVVSWLSEEYAGRPTSPSTDSSGGRDSTGETSSTAQPEKVLEGSST